MTRRTIRLAWRTLALTALLGGIGGIGGCGQRGPLVLPNDARPVQPPPAVEPEPQDDEGEHER
jgi:predicted small lipoprotein YifL